MHDFVSYLFYLLQRGMRFAVPAALICGLILAVCYAVCRKKGRRFPWGKAVCALLLVGWAAVTVFVTLLRSEPNEFAARQCNLQLFLAWREAYQRFTLQIWLNVLLNIALFVPLGVLLPLLWKPFRKWYAAPGAGFGVSLLIELTQLFTGSGMCDVDDLFTNTLGAMLGWCAALLVLALHQKSRTWPRYCALPGFTTFLMFFSILARGSMTSRPQPVQRILKSMPTRSTSKLDAPQGCFLRVRMVSPTAMSIFIRPLPSFLPRRRPAEPVCAAARIAGAAHTDIV